MITNLLNKKRQNEATIRRMSDNGKLNSNILLQSSLKTQNIFKSKERSFADEIERKLTSDYDKLNGKTLISETIDFKLSYILKDGEISQFSNRKYSKESIEVEIKKKQGNDDHYALYNPPSFINKIGKGFNNVGNTCFLNSALQCLCHTTPLISIFTIQKHIEYCNLKGKEICSLCNLGKVIMNSFDSKDQRKHFTPSNIIQNIKVISKSIRIGRQEDSHEFIVKLLEQLENNSLKQNKSENMFLSYKKENTENTIREIFGGVISSVVQCEACKFKSETESEINHISLVSSLI